ncbi:insulinase family protein [Candidatus Woesearchaeota archaeon]|nr:insulinase family protein [Candidatus Woesearchaeota archaeon]
MRKFKLKNGLTVLWEPRRSESVAIEVCVGTGSNNEPRNIAGISHFLEHMVFEGTKTRSAKEISETIENVGGEINAATSNERTYFYVKVPRGKFDLGLKILADIMKNPKFDHQSMEKERKVILEEIKMVNDQPMFYQWILFEKSIFRRHPTRNPVYGRVDSVRSITHKQMVDYYRKWYIPNNMIVSVVGNVNWLSRKVEAVFGDLEPGKIPLSKRVDEPKETRQRIRKERRKVKQDYTVIGYKTVPRTHKDSFVLDVISAIFSKGLSGRVSEEVRVKRGLAYSVGTTHECKKTYGFFATYFNCDKKNVELCKSLILDEIRKLDNIEKKELNEAREHIIGKILVDNEDSQRRANELAFWEFIRDAKLADQYIKNIREVTKDDILRVRDRFLHRNYTMVIIGK